MIRIGSGQSSKVHALNGEKEVKYIMDLAKHPSTLYQQINTYKIKKEAAKNKMLEIFSLYFHKLMNHVNTTRISVEKSEEIKRNFIDSKTCYDDACFELEIREYVADNLSERGLFPKGRKTMGNVRNQRRNLTDVRNYLYSKFIGRAEIVFSTLSSTGLKILAENHFSVCLIDEAAQSTEISTLIPLKLGCDQCILCGDPQQLSAVVHCKNGIGSNMLYHRSLFERLQRGGHDVHFLFYQYRMHPLICSFPSKYFYEGKLKNGLALEKFRKPYHKYNEYSPLVFYDLPSSQETLTEKTLSYQNENEANYCINLLIDLLITFPNDISIDQVGIISMYADQVKLLRHKYDSVLVPYLAKSYHQTSQFKARTNNIHVASSNVIRTVDGFQGQEKDVIILSTVRGDADSEEKGIGFIHDRQRMNVALTRAKYALLVVGRKTSLDTSEMWCDFIAHVQQNGKYIMVDETKIKSRNFDVGKSILTNNHNDANKDEIKIKLLRHARVVEQRGLGKESTIESGKGVTKMLTKVSSSVNQVSGKKMIYPQMRANGNLFVTQPDINRVATGTCISSHVVLPQRNVPSLNSFGGETRFERGYNLSTFQRNIPPHAIADNRGFPLPLGSVTRKRRERVGYEELEEGEVFE